VGRGTIPLQKVVNRVAPEEQKQKRISLPQRLQQALKRRSHDAVRIQGLDNLMVHFAKCCQPVPGDAITGIVSIGHGVSIHRVDCNNVRKGRIDEDRRIEVEWDVPEETVFPVQLSVIGEDRKNLLADISRSIADLDCNIQAGTFEGSNEYARCTFMVEVRNLHHLSEIIGAISRISSVSRVERTVFVQGNLPPEEES
jgi:GTP pyrophosphokinase